MSLLQSRPIIGVIPAAGRGTRLVAKEENPARTDHDLGYLFAAWASARAFLGVWPAEDDPTPKP